MKRLILFVSIAVMASCSSTDPEPDPLQTAVACDGSHSVRVGAQCVDGTKSSATGSGACSGHGGVNYWLCN